jgi:outer membrane protein OmpA-like peptidoglycan-associated protein
LKRSLERARAVASYLFEKGVAMIHVIIEGKGSSDPIMDEQTPEANEMNRRVEITFNDIEP